MSREQTAISSEQTLGYLAGWLMYPATTVAAPALPAPADDEDKDEDDNGGDTVAVAAGWKKPLGVKTTARKTMKNTRTILDRFLVGVALCATTGCCFCGGSD